jgi:hypothetical protein
MMRTFLLPTKKGRESLGRLLVDILSLKMEEEEYMRKFKCFECQNFGHYAG